MGKLINSKDPRNDAQTGFQMETGMPLGFKVVGNSMPAITVEGKGGGVEGRSPSSVSKPQRELIDTGMGSEGIPAERKQWINNSVEVMEGRK